VVQPPVGQVSLDEVHVLTADPAGAADRAAWPRKGLWEMPGLRVYPAPARSRPGAARSHFTEGTDEAPGQAELHDQGL
jgi:hypothetical protein